MESGEKSEHLEHDYYDEVAAFDKVPIQVGLHTNAGRGYVVTLAPIKGKTSPVDLGRGIPRPSGGTGRGMSMGRASTITSMKIGKDLKQPRPSTDTSSEITRQLRQTTGASYSNTLIEQKFGPKQSQDTTAQFEDAGTETIVHDAMSTNVDKSEATLVAEFVEKSKIVDNVKSGGAKKKKKGKDRSFQRYHPDSKTVEETNAMSDVDRSRLPKKTLAEVFRERPDYEKSYLSQRDGHGPFTLGSKNDFPAL